MPHREETEEDIADQIMWLRRTKWEKKYPWQARQVAQSGYPLKPEHSGIQGRPDRSIPREYPLSMSGEDQRHTYHEDELNELVDSRETLEDGRIVEYPPLPIDGGGGGAPATNPPNVIGGNNADL